MSASEEPAFPSSLSKRAQTFLRKTKSRREKELAGADMLSERFGHLGADFVERLVAFEQRYGGWFIDPDKSAIGLGVGHLLSRDIEPEVNERDAVVLVGTSDDADVLMSYRPKSLRERSWLHVSRMDREVGELAVSPEKWIERVVAMKSAPLRRARFWVDATSAVDPFVEGLGLKVDDVASDDVFVLAMNDSYVLERNVLGTPWLRGRASLRCATFDALVRALRVGETAGLRGGVGCSLSTIRDEALSAPIPRREWERALPRDAKLVVQDEGSAVHLGRNGSCVEVARFDDKQDVVQHLVFTAKTGKRREYVMPWGSDEEV